MTAPVTWQSAAIRSLGHDITVPVRIYRPKNADAHAGRLVWAHGGSWRSGSVADWHPALADLARRTRATVVGVDYRLAPCHPHPAALRDLLAVLAWADEQAPGEPVAVGGDSAGGTLAASAALVRRDQGRPLAAQLLAYPPLDPACRAASYHRDPRAFPSRVVLREAWRDYRGPGAVEAVRAGEYSTPTEAHDLAGAAPAALVVGALDPVVDDVRAYAHALSRDEVPVRYEELPGIGHGVFLASTHFRSRLATAYRDVLAVHTTQGVPR
ncbi:alpha/beta hydrolase [Yinghuangia soli]|uniref:Alpha/beta hydrolase n=1 Tax=Yinghuangia soli TaxID=2908204 RepID=A0AA41Q1H2_9ACTN|nr:alpha/beta hydrolase fold domain-containing protein [Yinghuangia soli]MCF2529825.1 alpha/beta hydrolase [Yinghuangia soli]